MKKLLLSALCCAGLVVVLPENVRAHGGQYRGPGDTVPPGPGGSGGRTGGPGGPSTGGPGGPSTGGPGGPSTGGPGAPSTGGPVTGGAAPGAPTTGGGGYRPPSDDLTRWDFWWEFNKDPYIRLRDAVHRGPGNTTGGDDDFYMGSTLRPDDRSSLRPSSQQILGEILPALKKAIDSTDQRDINSSCMVAMAKIGVDHPDFTLRSVFIPRLKTRIQEVRETAALSLGIAAIAGEDEMALLVGLAQDKERGRDAYGGEVDDRTRSFATYGLGLVAHKTTDLAIKRKAFEAMRTMIDDEKITNRNLKVAAINGMSILNIATTTEAEAALLDEVLKSLEGYYGKSLGAGENLIQAHVPTAIAKLITRDHKDADRYKAMFAEDLQGKGKVKRSGNEISESCALALGKLVRPYQDSDDKANPDNRYSKLLLEAWQKHKDIQTKNFAMISLGMIGGDLNKAAILKEFDAGSKNQEKPWCALALGVYSHWKLQDGTGGTADPFISQTLFDELKKGNEPSLVGALAIGLGLSKSTIAAEEMRKRMRDNIGKEEMAGYLALGLALMDDRGSIESIRGVVKDAVRRFTLLQQAAIALGKLGDKRVAEDLQKLMVEGEPNLAKLSAIARAIGFIGDSRTVASLKRMLFDDKLQELSRAFAAVALGGVADKEPLPWNSKIGVDNNYRAAVETLTDQSTGILDIL